MPPPVVTMLNGLVTAELSIVPEGANARRFAILKEANMPFQEVLQKLLDTKAEGEGSDVHVGFEFRRGLPNTRRPNPCTSEPTPSGNAPTVWE